MSSLILRTKKSLVETLNEEYILRSYQQMAKQVIIKIM